jgi:acyl-coenzyme A thioesterase PaaI-like protein
MDYEQLKAMLGQVVPFARHVGVEITEIGPGTATVRLPEGGHLLNHVGTQHAAALYAAAEAASGAAMASVFGEMIGRATPLARSAQIAYLKPARGPIDARANVSGKAEELLAALEANGRVEFPVEVALDGTNGVRVAEVTVAWHVRMNA